jgi:hypothetical protein
MDPILDLEQALIDSQRWNRYTYALNRPLRFTDPDGRDPLLITDGIGAAVYAASSAYQNVQLGHLFPQAGEFARNFKKAGIDVHNPKFGAWWTRPNHQQKAREYNDRWRQFFRSNDDPSRSEILDFGRQLAKEYGLEVAF